MTTTTAATATTAYLARPITPAALGELRVSDDAGQPLAAFTADEDGSPLRCCLRPAEVGERIALVSYAPLRRWATETGAVPGAYDEQGPVFIHAEECGGVDEADGGRYPFDRAGALRTVRRYSTDGRILGGRLLEIPDAAEDAFDAMFEEAFAEPEVALVHVRAVEYGCFLFEVRRG